MKPGLVVVADGLTTPTDLSAVPVPEPGHLVGWMPVPPPWLASVTGLAVMGGGQDHQRAFSDGRLRYLPVRYSALPGLLAGRLRPDLAVVTARPVPGGYQLAGGAGYAVAAAAAARGVVIAIDESLPPMDAPRVVGNVITKAAALHASPYPPEPSMDDTDLRIGSLMAELVPPGATVQYGPGSIGEAFIGFVQTRARIHSGIATEGVAALARRGLLEGQATAAYLFGGPDLYELARSGQVRVRGVEETHNPANLAALPRFFAANTALQVGLDGSINVERVGSRQIGGIGGHSDFCAAAAASPDGLSVIGLRSTRGGRSTIVPRVDVVTTPRSDVDAIVTEWGIAHLRGLDEEARFLAIVSIAHPELREELERTRAEGDG